MIVCRFCKDGVLYHGLDIEPYKYWSGGIEYETTWVELDCEKCDETCFSEECCVPTLSEWFEVKE